MLTTLFNIIPKQQRSQLFFFWTRREFREWKPLPPMLCDIYWLCLACGSTTFGGVSLYLAMVKKSFNTITTKIQPPLSLAESNLPENQPNQPRKFSCNPANKPTDNYSRISQNLLGSGNNLKSLHYFII